MWQAFLAEDGDSLYSKELLSAFFLPSGEIRMVSAQCELFQQNFNQQSCRSAVLTALLPHILQENMGVLIAGTLSRGIL